MTDVCTCGHDVTDHGNGPVGCINCACAAFTPTRRGGVSMKHTHNDHPRWIDAPMAEPWYRDNVAAITAEHGTDLIQWAERIAETYGRSGSLEVTAVVLALLGRIDAAGTHRYDPETQRCTCGALDHPDWGATA